MEQEKRKCIFTNQKADGKLSLSSKDQENHNWAKNIPCSKQYLSSKKDKSLTTKEFELVRLFYKLELAKLEVLNIEKQMQELREEVTQDFYKTFPEHPSTYTPDFVYVPEDPVESVEKMLEEYIDIRFPDLAEKKQLVEEKQEILPEIPVTEPEPPVQETAVNIEQEKIPEPPSPEKPEIVVKKKINLWG